METVLENLVYQQLWTDCKIYNKEAGILQGYPKQKIHPNDPENEKVLEYVYVSVQPGTASVAEYTKVFSQIEAKRILHAVVSEDMTVVYYVIYDGLQTPRRN